MNTQHGNLMAASVYGWTGGTGNVEAATRTDDIVRVAIEAICEAGDPPALIVGDLNADTEALLNLTRHLNEGQWTDCGAHANLWGAQPEAPTCTTANSAKATPRDFILANAKALNAIKSFEVQGGNDDIPTHKPVRVRIKVGDLSTKAMKYRKPIDAARKFNDMVMTGAEGMTEKQAEEYRSNQIQRLKDTIERKLEKYTNRIELASIKRDAEKM